MSRNAPGPTFWRSRSVAWLKHGQPGPLSFGCCLSTAIGAAHFAFSGTPARAVACGAHVDRREAEQACEEGRRHLPGLDGDGVGRRAGRAQRHVACGDAAAVRGAVLHRERHSRAVRQPLRAGERGRVGCALELEVLASTRTPRRPRHPPSRSERRGRPQTNQGLSALLAEPTLADRCHPAPPEAMIRRRGARHFGPHVYRARRCRRRSLRGVSAPRFAGRTRSASLARPAVPTQEGRGGGYGADPPAAGCACLDERRGAGRDGARGDARATARAMRPWTRSAASTLRSRRRPRRDHRPVQGRASRRSCTSSRRSTSRPPASPTIEGIRLGELNDNSRSRSCAAGTSASSSSSSTCSRC